MVHKLGPVFSERVFFSFVALADPARKREYNEWHQLDHLPENLRLPGVAHGDRWARTGDGTASPELAGVDYLAMYWFRPPYEQSVAEWRKLGEDSFQWGRGPLIPGVQRPLLGFFTPVLGYVAPRVRLSADALPFRPNRGLHVTVTELAEPHGGEAHAQFAWQDRTRIPELLACPGVAGAWTFSFLGRQRHSTLNIGSGEDRAPGSLRVRLLYLDEDPVEASREIAEREKEPAPHPEAERVLLSGPVRTIVPWRDW